MLKRYCFAILFSNNFNDLAVCQWYEFIKPPLPANQFYKPETAWPLRQAWVADNLAACRSIKVQMGPVMVFLWDWVKLGGDRHRAWECTARWDVLLVVVGTTPLGRRSIWTAPR